jgi:hypothetical protein
VSVGGNASAPIDLLIKNVTTTVIDQPAFVSRFANGWSSGAT